MTAFDPYAPPRSDPRAPIEAASSEPPPEGRYELEPEDSAAAVRSKLGPMRYFYFVVGLAVWGVGVLGGEMIPSALSMLLVFAFVTLSLVPWFSGRSIRRMSPEQRRVRVSFEDTGVTIADEAGSVSKLAWNAFAGRRETDTRVFLDLRSGLSWVLPARAWASAAEFAQVRAYTAANVAPAKKSRRALMAVLMWILLIALFVAIWSFFSDVPRPPH